MIVDNYGCIVDQRLKLLSVTKVNLIHNKTVL